MATDVFAVNRQTQTERSRENRVKRLQCVADAVG